MTDNNDCEVPNVSKKRVECKYQLEIRNYLLYIAIDSIINEIFWTKQYKQVNMAQF